MLESKKTQTIKKQNEREIFFWDLQQVDDPNTIRWICFQDCPIHVGSP